LKKLEEERKRQYYELKLFDRCSLIAWELGAIMPKKHGNYHVFKDDSLEIIYDDYAPNLEVFYKDQKVLFVHLGSLELFRPGKWLQKILELAKPLEEQKELDRYLREKGELLREMQKWEEVKE